MFTNNPKSTGVNASLCVSLVTPARSLDLQMENATVRDAFALSVEAVVLALREKKRRSLGQKK